jgi:hypothetical protein
MRSAISEVYNACRFGKHVLSNATPTSFLRIFSILQYHDSLITAITGALNISLGMQVAPWIISTNPLRVKACFRSVGPCREQYLCSSRSIKPSYRETSICDTFHHEQSI